MKKYIIVKCDPLNDDYETDAAREIVCVSDDPAPAGWNEEKGCGYEVYEIKADGSVELIRNYDEE